MGLVDEERTLLFAITEHCIAKKRITEIGFFTKICNKYVIMNDKQYARD